MKDKDLHIYVSALSGELASIKSHVLETVKYMKCTRSSFFYDDYSRLMDVLDILVDSTLNAHNSFLDFYQHLCDTPQQ